MTIQNMATSKNVANDEILKLTKYLQDHLYDSDAVIEDVLETKQSNIFYFITNKMQNESVFDVIIQSILCDDNNIDSETTIAISKQFECICICGKTLIPRTAVEWMAILNSVGIRCAYCNKAFTYFAKSNAVLYGCDPIRNEEYHPDGYGFCYQCSSIIRNDEEKYDFNDKPTVEALYYQRFVRSMQSYRINISLDTQNDRELLQSVLVALSLQGELKRSQHLKILNEEQYDDLSKRWAILLTDILNVESRYKMMSESINKLSSDQLMELRESITILMHTIIRS